MGWFKGNIKIARLEGPISIFQLVTNVPTKTIHPKNGWFMDQISVKLLFLKVKFENDEVKMVGICEPKRVEFMD